MTCKPPVDRNVKDVFANPIVPRPTNSIGKWPFCRASRNSADQRTTNSAYADYSPADTTSNGLYGGP